MTYSYLTLGMDEVGRGCCAGNVLACAAILPDGFEFAKLRDSKKMSKKDREAFFEYGPLNGMLVGIGIASVKEIEELNIRRATHLAMHRAVKHLVSANEFIKIEDFKIIIDGNDFVTNESWNFQTLIKGDDLVKSISAASCYAKVYRDLMMSAESDLCDENEDRYGWKTNAGYGTKAHKEAIIKYGMTPIHRKTFVETLLSK